MLPSKTVINRIFFIVIDYGLRGSASPVKGDWLCQWEMAIFDPPQNKHPLTDHQNISYR